MICRNCGQPMLREERCPSCGFDNGAKGLEAVLRELFRMFPREARANLIVLFDDLSGTAVEAKERRLLQLLCSTGSDKRLIRAVDEKRSTQAEIDLIVRELSEAFYDAATVRSACNVLVRALSTGAEPEQTAKPQKEQKSGGENAAAPDRPLIKSYYLEKNGALKYCDELLKIGKGVVTGFTSPGAPISKLFLRSGITAIGAKAFENAAIDRVVLPDGLRYIGAFAFAASSITSISLPDSLERIGANAFFRCGKLKKIQLPNKLSEIGARAFAETGLEEVKLPPYVTELPDFAFQNCKALKRAELSPFTRTIWSMAFGSSGIERLVIPTANDLNVRQSAFFSCNKLKEIAVPKGFDKACLPAAFRRFVQIDGKLSDLPQEDLPAQGESPLRQQQGRNANDAPPSPSDEALIHKSRYTDANGRAMPADGLLKIVEGVVTGFTSPGSPINTLTLCEGITAIGAAAFRHAAIDRVVLPEGLREIGKFAFSASSITSISLPDSLNRIADFAFFDCNTLKNVVLPKNLVEIGTFAFGFTALEDVQLPPGVTDLPDLLFLECNRLKTVQLSPNTRSIGNVAFGLSGTERLVIPTTGPLRIHPAAFSGCNVKLEILVPEGFDLSCLPENVRHRARTQNAGPKDSHPVQTDRMPAKQTELQPKGEKPPAATTLPLANGDLPLDCGGWLIIRGGVVTNGFSPVTIKELPLDEGITSIGASAFRNAKIEQMKLPKGLKKIEYRAFRDAQLQKIDLPDSVERIEKEAFAGCERLNSLHSSLPHHLPMMLKKIGIAAFENTAISGIVLPPMIEEVPERAFQYCDKLSYVWLSPNLRSIGSEAFARSGIERLIIPTSNWLNIAPDAFSGCRKLKMITVPKGFDLFCLPAEVRGKAVKEEPLGVLKLNYDAALGVR